MTETLKQLLHDRADDAHFDTIDVDTLVRAGERRVRHRALTVGAGALAATAVVAGAGLTQAGRVGDADGLVAEPLTTTTASYARGTTIHTGTGTVEVGHRVRAYVRTAVGYVVADSEGVVWSVTASGVTRVGATSSDPDRVRLVSDTDGAVAGWLDAGGDPVFLDQQSGETGFPLGGDAAVPHQVGELYAVDGTTAYWGDARGAVGADVGTGEQRRLDLPAPTEGETSGRVHDAEQGVLVVASDGGSTVRAPGAGAVFLDQAYGDLGDLSPDARWYAQDADEAMVFDAADGSRVPLATDHAFAAALEWIGGSRVVLIAQRTPGSPVELLTCTVPAGSCDVVADLAPSFEDFPGDFALPIGEPLEE